MGQTLCATNGDSPNVFTLMQVCGVLTKNSLTASLVLARLLQIAERLSWLSFQYPSALRGFVARRLVHNTKHVHIYHVHFDRLMLQLFVSAHGRPG